MRTVNALTPAPEVVYAQVAMRVCWGAFMAKKSKKSHPKSAKHRVSKGLLKYGRLLASDPEPARVTKVTAIPPKHSAARARERLAQLVAARFGADPRLA